MSLSTSLIPRGSNNFLPSFPSYQNLAELHGLPVVHKCYLADHFARCTRLCYRDLLGHYGCVNAIEFSNNGGEFIVSGGDDRRVMVWNVEKCVYSSSSPVVLKGEHRSNIFCAVFDNDNSHIFSAGNDNQALRHDLATHETVGLYFHDDPVYGLSVHPEDSNVFLTACDDGNVLLWDARTTTGSSDCIAHYTSAFHAAVFNPVDPHLIATANSRKGVQLWDIRVPKNCLQQFSNATPQLCAMGLKWDMTGHMITALRRRLPPVIYHISRPSAIAEFHHPGYSNVCTMKSNCFAGSKDQYIVSGSDDFNVYIWEVPADWADHEEQVTVGRAFLVLHGHRSIVNQVRFNPASHMLLSAGVEKVVKVWSPFSIPGGHSSGGEGLPSTRRQLYSHHEYLGLLHSRGLSIPYEHARETTEEDPCMLAFFDSLIDREKNDPLSDSHDSFGDDFNLSFILQADSGESSDSDSVGLSVNQLREILYQPSQDSLYGNQNEGVLRRLRDLSSSVAIRQLLHTVGDTTSSSSDDEDSERHVQVVLPEVPRDGENDHSSESAPVWFNRHRHRRNRNYRHQPQARVQSSSSGSSPSMVESSSSSGEEEHFEPDHTAVIGRYSPCSVDDNSSSSSSTDSSNHQKKTHRRTLKQRKQRLSQGHVSGLQEHENAGDTQENGENQLPGTTVHSTHAGCTDRTCSFSVNSTDDGYCHQVHDTTSQSWLNESTDSTKSNCGNCSDSHNRSHDLAPDECSASWHISNGDCIVPTLPGRKDCSGEEQGAVATTRRKVNNC